MGRVRAEETRMSIARCGVMLALVLLGVTSASAARAQDVRCEAIGTSTKDVLGGATLTWQSSFRCTSAGRSGTYAVTVRVSSAPGSARAVRLVRAILSHATPRPRGQVPRATAAASGIPVALSAGGSVRIELSGRYTLVSTDEGEKANLHLRLLGVAAGSDAPFRLGVNIHLRGT